GAGRTGGGTCGQRCSRLPRADCARAHRSCRLSRPELAIAIAVAANAACCGRAETAHELTDRLRRLAPLSGLFPSRRPSEAGRSAARRAYGGAALYRAHAEIRPADVGADVELRCARLVLGRARLSL